MPADHRHPPAGVLERRQLDLGLGLQPGVGVSGAGDEQDADALRDEVPDLLELLLRVARRVADLDHQVLLTGRLDHAARDLREVRVVDLVDDQSDRRGRPTG